MKKVVLVVLLLCSFGLAEDKPDPAKFTIDIHVTGSILREREHLNAFIDGRKLVLASMTSCEAIREARWVCAILPPANYKARIIHQSTTKKGRVATVYSILMADGSSQDYYVAGLGDANF